MSVLVIGSYHLTSWHAEIWVPPNKFCHQTPPFTFILDKYKKNTEVRARISVLVEGSH